MTELKGSHHMSSNKRVLVVEDETILAMDLSKSLEHLGYEVVGTAVSGREAIQKVRETRPDLILMDIKLKGSMDGIDVVDEIRSFTDPAVIYLTAHSDTVLFERAKTTDPYAFLTKPITPDELRHTADMALYKHSMEKRLRDNETRLEQAIEAANLALWEWNPANDSAELTESWFTLFGYDEQEISPSFSDLKHIIHPEDLQHITTALDSVFQGLRSEYQAEYRAKVKSGQWRWILTKGRITERDENGNVLRIAGIDQDITERKQAHDLVLQSERLKAVGELATGVAHNFNNLLQIVLGGAQIALTDLELGDVLAAKANLDQIVESAKFGAQTVKRLQDFARLRTDELSKPGTVFDLTKTVHEAIEMSKPWWKTRPEKEGVAVTLNRYLKKGCFVRGSENELFEVAVNLIKNAAEALPEGGEIAIRTLVQDDRVILVVKDNGIGIPEKNVGRVFEPFWTTKGFKGTGMGLSSCYGIVRDHHGEIEVESRPGQGASFRVELPSATDTSGEDEEPKEVSVDFNLEILVADDIPAVVEQVGRGLSRYGQTVYRAYSGREAIEIFKETRIEFIICDLAMPELNGLQVAKIVSEIAQERGVPKPPFIMLTGWGGQMDEIEKMNECGVDLVLEKPIDIPELIESIRELVTPKS